MLHYIYHLFGYEIAEKDLWDKTQQHLTHLMLKDIINKKYVLNHWCWDECICYHSKIYNTDSSDDSSEY